MRHVNGLGRQDVGLCESGGISTPHPQLSRDHSYVASGPRNSVGMSDADRSLPRRPFESFGGGARRRRGEGSPGAIQIDADQVDESDRGQWSLTAGLGQAPARQVALGRGFLEEPVR